MELSIVWSGLRTKREERKKWRNLNDGVEMFWIFNYIGLDWIGFHNYIAHSFQPLNIFINRIFLQTFSDIHLKYYNRPRLSLIITFFLLPLCVVKSIICRNGFFSRFFRLNHGLFFYPFLAVIIWKLQLNNQNKCIFLSLLHLIESHRDFLFWTVFVRSFDINKTLQRKL